MFEEKVMLKNEIRNPKSEERKTRSERPSPFTFRPSPFARFCRMSLLAVILSMCLPATSPAQQNWYYHTIHSNTLAVQYGRTVKLSYANQMSRTRQFKLSLYYIFDEYDSGEDRIKSDIYNLNLEFQYKLLHFGSAFVNTHAGFGGYYLQAKNLIDQKHDETKFSFVAGFQGEYFIQKSSLALLVDYDILYTPWSDVYEFLHLPRIGLGWTF